MIRELQKIVGRRLLDAYKRRKQRASDVSLEHCLETARVMLRGTRYCFLVTSGADGWSSARLVQPIADLDDFVIWMGTNPDLRKVHEIRVDPKVTLAFGSTKESANLVLYGEARIEADLALRKRYWKDEWRLFFPSGPTGDDYVLIRFDPLRMELMNFSRNVIPEPFGLKPAVLVKKNGTWRIQEHTA